MYGNDRMYLTTNTMKTMFRKMMDIWYANPMGKGRFSFVKKNKIVQSPTVEPDSLYDCTGVYVFSIKIRYLTFRILLYSRSR